MNENLNVDCLKDYLITNTLKYQNDDSKENINKKIFVSDRNKIVHKGLLDKTVEIVTENDTFVGVVIGGEMIGNNMAVTIQCNGFTVNTTSFKTIRYLK